MFGGGQTIPGEFGPVPVAEVDDDLSSHDDESPENAKLPFPVQV